MANKVQVKLKQLRYYQNHTKRNSNQNTAVLHSVTSVKRRAKGLTKYVRYKDVSFILKFFSQVFYLYRGLPYIEGR